MTETPATTFCPDCGREIPSGDFVAHRRDEHPPVGVRQVSGAGGIESGEAHGYQD